MSKSIKTVIMFLMVALISVTTIVSDLIKFGATSSVFNTAYWSNHHYISVELYPQG